MRTLPHPGLVIALLVALTGCEQAPESQPIELAAAEIRDIAVTATAAGAIEPITVVEVKSQASGEIVEVSVEEGDAVTAGQLLVRVDPRIPTNAVNQAEADSIVARAELDNAESQLARSEELHKSQAITDQELENARLARASAFAALIRSRRALEDAKIALEDTEVRAPFNGVILGRAVEPGTVIASASRDVGGGAVLLRMATLDTVQIRALVDETDIGMVRPGADVAIEVASFPNRRFQGKVERIGIEAVLQQNVTMFPVLVKISNSERLLRPGMNAEIEVELGRVEGVLALPNAALRPVEDALKLAEQLAIRDLGLDSVETLRGSNPPPRGADNPSTTVGYPADGPDWSGESAVFLYRNREVSLLRLTTGITDYEYIAVDGALQPGDSVVLLPTLGLLEELRRREEWAARRAGSPLGGNR